MKIRRLKATQKILRINWVVVPALGIWIWNTSGFSNAILFVILWFVAVKIWNGVTRRLIARAGRSGVGEYETFMSQISGEVPGRMASMMIFGFLGSFILPWVVAGLLLIEPVASIVKGHLAGLWGTALAGQPWERYVLSAENLLDSLRSHVVGVTPVFSREVWAAILLAGGVVSVGCIICFSKRRTRIGAERRGQQVAPTSPPVVGRKERASPAVMRTRGQKMANVPEKSWDEMSTATEQYPAYLSRECPNCAGNIYLEDMKCPRCHQTFHSEKVASLIDLVLNLHKDEIDPVIDFKSATKECPACIESIKLEAVICRYCRRTFTAAEVAIEKMKALRERVKQVDTDDDAEDDDTADDDTDYTVRVAAAEVLSPAEETRRAHQRQLEIEYKIQEQKKRQQQHMKDPLMLE